MQIVKNGDFSKLPIEHINAITTHMGYRQLAAVRATCHFFHEFISASLSPLVFRKPQISMIISCPDICLVAHNVSLQILVLGWAERFNWNHQRKGCLGAIYDLTTGCELAQLKGPLGSAELRHLIIDPAHERVIAAIKYSYLAEWNLSGDCLSYQNVNQEISGFVQHKNSRVFAQFWGCDEISSFALKSVPLAPRGLDKPTHFSRDKMTSDPFRDWICFEGFNSIKIADASNKNILQNFETKTSNLHIYCANQSKLIYVVSDKIIVHDFVTQSSIQEFNMPKHTIRKLSYDEDSQQLCVISETSIEEIYFGWVSVWDLPTNQKIIEFMPKSENDLCYCITCEIFLPKDKLLIVGTLDGSVVICDLRVGEVLHRWNTFKSFINTISFDPNLCCLFVTTGSFSTAEESKTYRMNFQPVDVENPALQQITSCTTSEIPTPHLNEETICSIL